MYVILDTETTGLDPHTNQITEIYALKLDDNLNYWDELHIMVRLNDGQEYPQEVIDLTGITPEMLVGGMDEKEAIQKLGKFCYGATLVIQYAPFDLSFLYCAKAEPEKYICTRTMAKILFPTESASLKPTYKRLFGEEFPNHHRADADTKATARVFRELKKRADALGIDYMNLVGDYEDRKLTFVPSNARVIDFKRKEEKE